MSAPQTFAAHASPVTAMVFSPTGDRLVTCDGTGVVLLWSNLAAPEPTAWAVPAQAAAAAAAPSVASAAAAAASVNAGRSGQMFGGEQGDGDLEEEEEEEEEEAAPALAVSADRLIFTKDCEGGARGVAGGNDVFRTCPLSTGSAGDTPWHFDAADKSKIEGGVEEVVTARTMALAAAAAAAAAAHVSPATHAERRGGGGGFASMLDQTPPPTIQSSGVRFSGKEVSSCQNTLALFVVQAAITNLFRVRSAFLPCKIWQDGSTNNGAAIQFHLCLPPALEEAVVLTLNPNSLPTLPETCRPPGHGSSLPALIAGCGA